MRKLFLLPVFLLALFSFSGCDLVDINGYWTGEVVITSGPCDGGPYEFSIMIVQDGRSVSGSLTYNEYDYTFSGTVDGKGFSVDGVVDGDGPLQHVELEGLSVGDLTMSGSFTWSVTEATCSGTFSVERVPEEV